MERIILLPSGDIATVHISLAIDPVLVSRVCACRLPIRRERRGSSSVLWRMTDVRPIDPEVRL